MKPLTIRSRPIKAAGATLPGVLTSTRKYLWYYSATWPDGSLVATLHLGEGIVPAGEISALANYAPGPDTDICCARRRRES